MLDLTIVRIIFVFVIAGCAYYFQPFQIRPPFAIAAGIALGGAIILFEMRLERVSLKRLIG